MADNSNIFISPHNGKIVGDIVTLDFSVMTYNVCRGVNTIGTKFDWKERYLRILKMLSMHLPDILLLQEMRRFEKWHLHDLIDDFLCELRNYGYNVVKFRCNATPKAMVNVICFKENKFQLDMCKSFYLTDTPYTPSVQGSDQWGKVMGYVRLFPTVNDKIISNRPIDVYNAHFSPFVDKDKLHESTVFNDIVCRTQQKNSVIFGGDFNFFGSETDKMRAKVYNGLDNYTTNLRTGMWVGEGVYRKFVEDPSSLSQRGTWVGFNPLDRPTRKTNLLELLDGLGGKNLKLLSALIDLGEYFVVNEDHDETEFHECPSDHAPIIAQLRLE